MKKQFLTVQETLATVKKKALVKMYIHEHIDSKTIQKYGKKAVKQRLKNYIKYLLTIDTKPNNDKMIFYVSHHLETDGIGPKPYFNLQKMSELGSNYSNYGCEFTPFNKALGYYIANNWRTKYYLKELLVDILYDLSWTGYRQENLQATYDDLEKSEKEIKNGDTVEISNSEQLYSLFGLDRTKEDHFDSKEYQLMIKINHLLTELSNHSQNREVSKIKTQLKE